MSDKPSFGERLKHSWNAFVNPIQNFNFDYGRSTYINPNRVRMTMGNEKSIVTAVYNRIALDVAALDIKHVRLDDSNERFKEVIDDGLNKCLTLNPNKDQISNSFIQDVVLSLFDEGSIAIVPVDTDINPKQSDGFDITSMRIGQIINWYPDHVKLRIYNDKTGKKEETTLPKSMVAIVENPFYSVMNEPNSVAKRLIRKLNILDVIDDQSASGKLDLIVQLPGVIKTEARKKQAEDRRKNIEDQLNGTKYGIAYIDGTEKVTQLNRSIENNLMNQITFLTSMLYSQLGVTEEVLKGTADPQTMLNYHNNTIVPVINALVKSMQCKFISKTARTRHHAIMYFRDPFKSTTVDKISEMADKFTRNEIASSNELRSVIGWKPVDDPRADELRNKNLNAEAGYDPMYTDQSVADEQMAEQPYPDENGEEGGNEGPIEILMNEDIGNMKLSELPKL